MSRLRPNKMATFTDLPADIILAIEPFCESEDLKALCFTCKSIMVLLETSVYQQQYEELLIDEGANTALRVQAISEGTRARYVRHIKFSPDDPLSSYDYDIDNYDDSRSDSENEDSNDETDDEREETPHPDWVKLSPETRDVLASLNRFPNLETFTFDCGYWDPNNWEHEVYNFMDDGSYLEDNGTSLEPWRSMIDDSIKALSESAGAFTSLKLLKLPPNKFPRKNPKWHALLQNLTYFEMDLLGMYDHGALGTMTVAHQDYLSDLREQVFDHLINVERFSLCGHGDALIGGLHEHEPIKWSLIKMPKLTDFNLNCANVEGGLATFLARHADSLANIGLWDCFATKRADWKRLFKKLHHANSSTLIDFHAIQARPSRRNHGELIPDGEKLDPFLSAEVNEIGRLDQDDPPGDVGLDEVLAEFHEVELMVARNRSAGDVMEV